MARGTFQKRQKEMKRQEKQRMKAAKRAQRKIEKSLQGDSPSSAQNFEIAPDDPHASSDSLTLSDSLVE